MYEKFAVILRLETTSNVSSFKHHRKVEHRKGPATRAIAPSKTTTYPTFATSSCAVIAVISPFSPHSTTFRLGVRVLDRLTQPRSRRGKTVKGINFFYPTEQRLLRALQRPGFNIPGIGRAHLLPVLDTLSPATVSRQLARLRALGLIKRIAGTYRYYLTRIGRSAVAACCRHHHPSSRMIKSAHKPSRLRSKGTKERGNPRCLIIRFFLERIQIKRAALSLPPLSRRGSLMPTFGMSLRDRLSQAPEQLM